ncbi:UNKNOWN [Stylonychia lemnae]|uniref:Uncharacterized protein n=1 Tax=Stylonychia lemnae TaxID=5949 RepID=A0A077ZWE6_STYLE|nr:UNKNOWN [Stylonychia lemnae]|eukprot:CDW73911.1 UNKNOWN [Stylonychia lemnae]
MLNLGLLDNEQMSEEKVKFRMYNSSLILSNLSFKDANHLIEVAIDSALICNTQSYKWVNITNCKFELKEILLQTSFGFNLHFRDNYIDQSQLESTYYGSGGNQDCSILEETYEQTLFQIFENNTFYGFNNDKYQNIYFEQFFGDTQFLNNKFYGNQQSPFTSPIYFQFQDTCQKDHAERRILFKGNIIDYGQIPYYENNLLQIEYQKSAYSHLTVEIIDNIIQNTIYGVQD